MKINFTLESLDGLNFATFGFSWYTVTQIQRQISTAQVNNSTFRSWMQDNSYSKAVLRLDCLGNFISLTDS